MKFDEIWVKFKTVIIAGFIVLAGYVGYDKGCHEELGKDLPVSAQKALSE